MKTKNGNTNLSAAEGDTKNGFAVSLAVIFFLSLAGVGLFYEWACALSSAVLLVWIFLRLKSTGAVTFKTDLFGLSVVFLCAGYFLTFLWAVDRGQAFMGALKFFPLVPFIFALTLEKGASKLIKSLYPYFAAVLTAVSFVLMTLPLTSDYFTVAGRMSGVFQYPNTFALVILVGELMLVSGEGRRVLRYVTALFLAVGIFYTGSRTVMVLAVLSNLVLFFWLMRGNRRNALILLGVLLVAGGASLGLAFAGVRPFSRLLSINFGESTFVGRFLYFRDALPVILKHPFGVGYSGYYFMQPSFQTGLYSVRFIHNDILQFALDVGWLPCAFFVFAWMKKIFGRGAPFPARVILSVFFLHVLFDFDLQFVAVFMLLILLADPDGNEGTVKKKSLSRMRIASVALVPVMLYFAVAFAFYSFEFYSGAKTLYPFNTDLRIRELIDAETADEMDRIADEIIAGNEYISVAYSAKARAAYSKGDFGALIEYKHKALDTARLTIDEYEDYCVMLINGISLYEKSGDKSSADVCRREILYAVEKYYSNLNEMSKLGKMIMDQPQPAFSPDVESFAQALYAAGYVSSEK